MPKDTSIKRTYGKKNAFYGAEINDWVDDGTFIAFVHALSLTPNGPLSGTIPGWALLGGGAGGGGLLLLGESSLSGDSHVI